MKKQLKTIGILGGMGPAASAHFYQQLITQAQTQYGAIQDNNYPPMIIYNLPLANFDETGVTNSVLVKEQLITAVKMLEQSGADFIVIVCNTVHAYINTLQSSIDIPILNILEITAQQVAAHNLTTVGILSSATTRELQLYENQLTQHKITTLHVTNDQQIELDNIILQVMTGKATEHDAAQLQLIGNSLIKNSAEGIIIGCTELPLALSTTSFTMPMVNSTQTLIQATLQFAYEK